MYFSIIYEKDGEVSHHHHQPTLGTGLFAAAALPSAYTHIDILDGIASACQSELGYIPWKALSNTVMEVSGDLLNYFHYD